MEPDNGVVSITMRTQSLVTILTHTHTGVGP